MRIIAREMNWLRGLIRGWIVLSVAWSIYGFIVTVSNMNAFAPNFGWDLEFWKKPLLAILAPWLLTAAVAGGLWTYRGLRSN